MKWAQPTRPQRVLVLPRRIADVPREPEPRPRLVGRADHHAISRGLGDDRRRRHRGGRCVPVDHSSVLRGRVRQPKPIDDTGVGRRVERGQAVRQQAQVRLVEAVSVDGRSADSPDDNLLRVTEDG